MNNPGQDTHLIIFAKDPKPGFAKTRLIPALGEAGAAELARKLLCHTANVAASTKFNVIDLCITPAPAAPIFKRIAAKHRFQLTCQGEGNLGERMMAAFSRHLEICHKVLLIGTDAPDLTDKMLCEASLALDTHDAVFIPAFDGGYALVGLSSLQPSLFSGIAWSTHTVMEATRTAATAAKLRWLELPVLHDIDEPSDLVHLPINWSQIKE